MIRVAICDDDIDICNDLEDLLHKYNVKSKIKFDIDVFYNAESLLDYISKENNFNIIFLDIQMEGISGIEAGSIIKKNPLDIFPLIIYISSHQGYALELFDQRPFNFILKPLDDEKVLNEFITALEYINNNTSLYKFKFNGQYHQVQIGEIIYFESIKRKINIVTANKTYEFYGKMEEIACQISNADFIPIHRSFFINYNHVRRFTYETIQMSNDITLPISQNKRKSVRSMLLHMMHEDKNG